MFCSYLKNLLGLLIFKVESSAWKCQRDVFKRLEQKNAGLQIISPEFFESVLSHLINYSTRVFTSALVELRSYNLCSLRTQICWKGCLPILCQVTCTDVGSPMSWTVSRTFEGLVTVSWAAGVAQRLSACFMIMRSWVPILLGAGYFSCLTFSISK